MDAPFAIDYPPFRAEISRSRRLLQREAILSANPPEIPKSGNDSTFGLSKFVLAAFQMSNELAVLNSHHWPEV
jgi:hypothetical protein